MVGVQSGGQLYCLRCKTTELVGSPRGSSFFECPKCHRGFIRETDGTLRFCWPHPISLVLYPVIFEADPGQHCERIADLFVKEKSGEQIDLLIQEIKLELEDPTQQIRDILTARASEEDLRNYLRCVADRLEKTRSHNS
jgi:hypothetical protein